MTASSSGFAVAKYRNFKMRMFNPIPRAYSAVRPSGDGAVGSTFFGSRKCNAGGIIVNFNLSLKIYT